MRGITNDTIQKIARRAEESVYGSRSRSADRVLIENAIREAFQIVDAKLI